MLISHNLSLDLLDLNECQACWKYHQACNWLWGFPFNMAENVKMHFKTRPLLWYQLCQLPTGLAPLPANTGWGRRRPENRNRKKETEQESSRDLLLFFFPLWFLSLPKTILKESLWFRARESQSPRGPILTSLYVDSMTLHKPQNW